MLSFCICVFLWWKKFQKRRVYFFKRRICKFTYICIHLLLLYTLLVLYYFFITLVPKKTCVNFYPPPPIVPLLLVFGEISKPPDYSVLESNNLKIELMQWQPHMVRGSSFDKNKNISLPKKRILEKKIKRFEVWINFQRICSKSWRVASNACRKKTSLLYLVETAHCLKYWHLT